MPISWHIWTEETKSNTTKANNAGAKQSKLKQKNTENAKPKQIRKKSKSKPKPKLTFDNCSHCVCAYHCVQLSYTAQHRTLF